MNCKCHDQPMHKNGVVGGKQQWRCGVTNRERERDAYHNRRGEKHRRQLREAYHDPANNRVVMQRLMRKQQLYRQKRLDRLTGGTGAEISA